MRLAGRWYWKWKTNLWLRHFFGKLGRDCIIQRPMLINRPERMFFGDRVVFQPDVRIEVVARKTSRENPRIEIGSDVNIEQGVHIVAQNLIRIGNRVSIGGYSCIVDIDHPYSDVADSRRIGDRWSDDGATTEIGDDCFIGFGSTILPGVKIGKYVIIGTRSVVGKDIPDYSVAAGAPAKVVKRYDHSAKQWVRST
jgi:acetyltransferase-like isoleucine patch superfamily enzyme